MNTKFLLGDNIASGRESLRIAVERIAPHVPDIGVGRAGPDCAEDAASDAIRAAAEIVAPEHQAEIERGQIETEKIVRENARTPNTSPPPVDFGGPPAWTAPTKGGQ